MILELECVDKSESEGEDLTEKCNVNTDTGQKMESEDGESDTEMEDDVIVEDIPGQNIMFRDKAKIRHRLIDIWKVC